MKKILSIVGFLYLTLSGFSQTKTEMNRHISVAEKATISLGETLNFSPEQALAVKQIELNKFADWASIESLKTTDLNKFVQKRFTIAEIANNAIISLLESKQLKVFVENTNRTQLERERITATMQKSGAKDAEILQKLANIEL